jgi:uncharacterized protein
MLNRFIRRTADFCIRHRWLVIGFGVILGAHSATYAERHFGINSDISKLISANLPWRQRELAFQQAFPTHIESILAVVHAPTPELASAAHRDRAHCQLFIAWNTQLADNESIERSVERARDLVRNGNATPW